MPTARTMTTDLPERPRAVRPKRPERQTFPRRTSTLSALTAAFRYTAARSIGWMTMKPTLRCAIH